MGVMGVMGVKAFNVYKLNLITSFIVEFKDVKSCRAGSKRYKKEKPPNLQPHSPVVVYLPK